MQRTLRLLVAGMMGLLVTAEVQAKAVAVNGTSPIRWIIYYGNPEANISNKVWATNNGVVLPTSADVVDFFVEPNHPPFQLRNLSPQYLGLTEVTQFPDVVLKTFEVQSATNHEYPIAPIFDNSNIEAAGLFPAFPDLGIDSLEWVDLTASDYLTDPGCSVLASVPPALDPPAGTDCINSSVFANLLGPVDPNSPETQPLHLGYLVGTTQVLHPTAEADQEFHQMSFINPHAGGSCKKVGQFTSVLIHNAAFFGGAINLDNYKLLKDTPEYLAAGIHDRLKHILKQNIKQAKRHFVSVAGYPVFHQCSKPVPLTPEEAFALLTDDGDPNTPPIGYFVAAQNVDPGAGEAIKP